MRCPFCAHADTAVKDSRPSDDQSAIRRRRQCGACGARFTTFERVQLRELTVVKSGGERQPFEREKLTRSLRTALRKRPVEAERLEQVVSGITRQLEVGGDAEIASRQIGELAMAALQTLDPVAYVRYASVYRDFREAADFRQFLGALNCDEAGAGEGE